MLATVKGYVNLDECGQRANKKSGEVIPYVSLVSGKEIVQILGVDYSEMKPFGYYEIPCEVTSGQYGLYVKAISEGIK